MVGVFPFLFFKVLLNLPGSAGRPRPQQAGHRVSSGVSFCATAGGGGPPAPRASEPATILRWPPDGLPGAGGFQQPPVCWAFYRF